MGYLSEICSEMKKRWPENRRINIVCHGHSIVCGYMADNIVKPMDAYPQQLLCSLSERFPFAVVSVISTAIGGENSLQGAKRFKEDVLSHKPDIVTIDYGRNDMFLSKFEMERSWEQMIKEALEYGAKVILISPAADSGEIYYDESKRLLSDDEMSDIIRGLAKKYEVGIGDANKHFNDLFKAGHTRTEYAVSLNHINKAGHRVVCDSILENFDY